MITEFDFGDLNLDNKTLMDSTPLYRVCIDQGRTTMKCCQIASLAKFVKTCRGTFLARSTIIQNNYFRKRECQWTPTWKQFQRWKTSWKVQVTGAALATATNVLRASQRYKAKAKVCKLDLHGLL